MSLLQILRKSSRSVSGLLIVAFCVLLMASWNIDSTIRRTKWSNDVAITVGKKQVSMYEYELMRDRIGSTMRSRFGKQFDMMRSFLEPQIASQTLDTLVLRLVMEGKAQEFGLIAAPIQVRNKIISEAPFYGRDFDPEVYSEFVRENNMTKAEYENLVSLDIIRDQLQTTFQDISYLPDSELKEIYNADNTKYRFRYTFIPASRFASEVQKSEEQLQKFLSEHEEDFRKPRSIKYSWTEFKPEDFTSRVEVTEQDLKSLYQDTSVTFVEPKQYHLRKLFFPKGTSETETAVAKAKVDAALERLKAGEDFKKLAGELNEDPELKGKSGDIGWSVVKLLEENAKNAIANLDIGEHTSQIDESNGNALYFLEEVKPERQKPFEEVRAQLEIDLRRENAPIYAQAEAQSFLSEWKKGDAQSKSLIEYAPTKGKVAQTTDLVPENMSPTGAAPSLTKEVMKLSQGEREEISIDGKTYVVELLEEKDSYIPKVDEVRANVAMKFEAEESKRLAKAFGEKLISEKKPLTELAAANALEIKETDAVTRKSPTGEIFQSPDVADAAFALHSDKPLADKVFQLGDKVALVELEKIEVADTTAFDKDKESLRSEQAKMSADRLLASFVEVLKKDSDVQPNPQLTKKTESETL